MKKQIISLIIGLVICIVIGFTDYKDIKNLSIFIYVLGICLLLAVLLWGTGEETTGSRRWLVLPVIGNFQPSEIAKIAYILFVAKYFEKIKLEETVSRKNLISIAVITAIPVLLIMVQPDAGTAIVFLFIFFLMVYVCGIPYRYIAIAFGAALVFLPVAWLFILKPYQKWRIKTFLNPELEPLGAGLQVLRSKMAIGSGRLFGYGLYNGIQSQSGGVPVRESDFIFTVIAEEMGFIGAVSFLVLIFFILLRCLYIARYSSDSYGSFVTVGLLGMLGFHFIQNICMNLGLLPVTGVPLPFVSAGGSAMVTNLLAIGIIISVSTRRKRVLFKAK